MAFIKSKKIINFSRNFSDPIVDSNEEAPRFESRRCQIDSVDPFFHQLQKKNQYSSDKIVVIFSYQCNAERC
jgi:hypothetical protein